MSTRFHMCLSHMSLKFVLPTKGFIALRLWAFEHVRGDMCGLDVPPQACLSSERSRVRATSPSASELARLVSSKTQSECE